MLNIIKWYRILRAYGHWTRLEALRYAIWLSRP